MACLQGNEYIQVGRRQAYARNHIKQVMLIHTKVTHKRNQFAIIIIISAYV